MIEFIPDGNAVKDECILCVHPLPLVTDLILLLFDGLAYNILLELRDRIQNDWPTQLDDNSGLFHSNIKILSGVTGMPDISGFSSISDLFTEFTVSTASKNRIRGRSNTKDLGLIRYKVYRHHVTVIEKIIKTDTKVEVIRLNTPTVNKDWDDIGDIEVPKYVGIVELVHAVSFFCDNH